MDFIERLGERPALALIVAGLLLGVLAAIKVMRGESTTKEGGRAVPGLDKLLAAGRYREAAILCLRHDRYSDAQEFFLRANEPARAAWVAQRVGNHRVAGELYEQAGDLRKAATCYERVGMGPRAQELLAKVEREEAAAAASRLPPDPSRGARPAEEQYQTLAAKAPADELGRVEVQQAAQRAADEAMAAGEIQRAANIYRDAGLHEEAIHLYANVLGMPGEAATLVAARGHHDRAAELFESAGMKDRAAIAWVDAARKTGRAENYVDRVAALEPTVCLRMLEEATNARPVSAESAELYYRFGLMLERLGDRVRALEVLLSLRRTVADYKDVGARVAALTKAARPGSKGALADVVTMAEPSAEGARVDAKGPTTVVLQNFQVGPDMNVDAMQALARGAALAAQGRGESGVVVMQTGAGFDTSPTSLELLYDTEVREARKGPSLAKLTAFATGKGCSLNNIEVYYRMGLRCLADGDWGAALQHFEAVEEASPGYRDAAARASEVRRWQNSVRSKVSAAMGPSSPGTSGSMRYDLHGELGRGGMAVVYRATDTVLGRDVALKFIAQEALGRKEFRDMFLREARSVAQLNHPNIVTIYDVGSIDGRAFIAMELVDGKTVDDLVVEQGKLPVIDALRVAVQVLDALDYAHARQIVHRDIKPSNMMRSGSGHVKLMDFGLAKPVDGNQKTSLIVGTPAYMPPEQFTGKNVDHRADIFSVGASLYEMLTGDLPFPTPLRLGPPPPARERVSAVPTAVDDALRVALDPDPVKRFASAREFCAAIQQALGGLERSAQEGALPEATLEAPTRLASRSSPNVLALSSAPTGVQHPTSSSTSEVRALPTADSRPVMDVATAARGGRARVGTQPGRSPLMLRRPTRQPDMAFAPTDPPPLSVGASLPADPAYPEASSLDVPRVELHLAPVPTPAPAPAPALAPAPVLAPAPAPAARSLATEVPRKATMLMNAANAQATAPPVPASSAPVARKATMLMSAAPSGDSASPPSASGAPREATPNTRKATMMMGAVRPAHRPSSIPPPA